MNKEETQIVLASNSPRRQELLKKSGFEFEVFTTDFDESFPANIQANNVAEYLAIQKNKHYRTVIPNKIIITADTTVVLDQLVLNKPQSTDEARRMLRMLSENTHHVITGICISDMSKSISFTDITKVSVSSITEEEITFYLENFSPYDKAGSYGIQEWFGLNKINKIEGSYFNVMGLPTHLIYKKLKDEFGL